MPKDFHNQLKDIERRASIVISGETPKHISDFKDIHEYLSRKFDSVDVTDIKIYIAPSSRFAKANWSEVGGLYIPHLLTVLVKDRITIKSTVDNSIFANKMLGIQAKVEMDDVLVHEMIHAVSHKGNRSSQAYRNMEEIFVYTNCIEYYLSKGMTEHDIVKNVILPFCVEDVVTNNPDMNKIMQNLHKTGVKLINLSDAPMPVRQDFFDEHADFIVEEIRRMATEKGNFMIETYKKYGQGLSLIPSAPVNSKRLRFSCIRHSDL